MDIIEDTGFLLQLITFAEGKISLIKPIKKKLSKEEENQLLQEITSKFNNQTTPYYAASRLWVDAIIDPMDTRKWISMGIKAANNAPIEKKFNLGLLQT